MERNDLEFCFTKCTQKKFNSSHSNYLEFACGGGSLFYK